MATTHTVTGIGGGLMTTYAMSLLAKAMYEKGRSFIGASLLFNQKNGNEFVVLHLLCQGIEIVLKAMLLAKDYSHYKPRLKDIGHNLIKAAAAARRATGQHVFTHGTLVELQRLNAYYQQHLLRYAGNVDIFIDPVSIPHERVFRHTLALVRYADRKGTFNVDVA